MQVGDDNGLIALFPGTLWAGDQAEVEAFYFVSSFFEVTSEFINFFSHLH